MRKNINGQFHEFTQTTIFNPKDAISRATNCTAPDPFSPGPVQSLRLGPPVPFKTFDRTVLVRTFLMFMDRRNFVEAGQRIPTDNTQKWFVPYLLD